MMDLGLRCIGEKLIPCKRTVCVKYRGVNQNGLSGEQFIMAGVKGPRGKWLDTKLVNQRGFSVSIGIWT